MNTIKKVIYIVLICNIISCDTRDKYRIVSEKGISYVMKGRDTALVLKPTKTGGDFIYTNNGLDFDYLDTILRRKELNYNEYFEFFNNTDFYKRIKKPFKPSIGNYILAHQDCFDSSYYSNANLLKHDISFIFNLSYFSLIEINKESVIDSLSHLLKAERANYFNPEDEKSFYFCLIKQQKQYLQYISQNFNLSNTYFFSLISTGHNKIDIIYIKAEIDRVSHDISLSILNPEFFSGNLYYHRFEI